jgi:hypothetical protein
MAHYGEYLPWGIYLMSAVGAWRFLPLAIVRLVAALTSDEIRHRQCMEVLRLARRDAARMSAYTTSMGAERSSQSPQSRRMRLDLDLGPANRPEMNNPPKAHTGSRRNPQGRVPDRDPITSRPGPQVARNPRTRKRSGS